MMILLFSIYCICIFKSFLMFESDFQCSRCVNHPAENTLCIISFIIFVNIICIIECDTSSHSNRWMCSPQRRCPLFYWHLGAIWRLDKELGMQNGGRISGQRSTGGYCMSGWPLTSESWIERSGASLMMSPGGRVLCSPVYCHTVLKPHPLTAPRKSNIFYAQIYEIEIMKKHNRLFHSRYFNMIH